jgi:hypothetical protein
VEILSHAQIQPTSEDGYPRPVADSTGGQDPADRIRTLLLRGDNVLKQSGDRERLERALAAFEQAEELAGSEAVDPRVRELVARRIASVRGLLDE